MEQVYCIFGIVAFAVIIALGILCIMWGTDSVLYKREAKEQKCSNCKHCKTIIQGKCDCKELNTIITPSYCVRFERRNKNDKN